MKRILLLTIFTLTFICQAFGQANSNCPTVKITSPSEVTPIGGNMNFSVSLMGKFKNRLLQITWTVSNGLKFDGQGKSSISIPIDRNLAGERIIATVEIKGLPEGCGNKISAVGKVESLIMMPHSDLNSISGDSKWYVVMSAIQNLGLALKSEKGSKGAVIFRFTNNSELNKVKQMQQKLIQIAKKRKISFFDKNLMKIEKGDVYEIYFEFIPPPKN